MSEQHLRDVLSAYGASAPAPDQADTIVRQAQRRRARRRWTTSTVAVLILCFSFLTFAPVGGSALAVIRKEIQPTLFLKTDLATARQTIRTPLTLPPSFPDYHGTTAITDDTPAVVGRWLSNEMVGVYVTDEPDGMGTIHLDLRRTDYKPEPEEEWWSAPQNSTAQQPVTVGGYEGVVFLWKDGRPMSIRWRTDTHLYRLMAPGCRTVEELVALAEQIH